MKANHNTGRILVTSSSSIMPFIKYCERHRLEWRSCAEYCGLPLTLLSSNHWLPTNDVMKFFYKLDSLHGDKFRIQAGKQAAISLLSLGLEKRAKGAKTLAEAVTLLTDELVSLSNHVTIWVERKDDAWWLCHRSSYRQNNLGFEISEWLRTLALVNFCQILLGRDWYPEKADLASTNPYNRKSPLPKTEIKLGCEYGAISIPLDESYSPFSISSAQPNWFEAVDRLITSYACLPWFNIDWFAKLLGMTPRTLQRNLKTKGLIFKEMKEAARLAKAKELLEGSEQSVPEICWQVGYSDRSNFNRAFKKRVEMTPANYRKLIRQSDLTRLTNREKTSI
ncbi:AraC family transcriptional regulator [Vibrio sp. D404a]|uniref:helix-turn-helix domain-containing protein n=1 Tax=unclassified Vibrio TaxID=2614977 RepID=UPI002552CD40|nr:MULTISPECIES: AraC family transcriptional regulator [unclassified Vibrio]MDK9735940.1 AraC family transcriptional regulator [Vibrio sp. D404a]MDK9797894.1 AraC family transcriptional regulator [Vibrio sp. D449a]